MQQFEWIHGAWLGLAIMLEIAANVLLKFSDGFAVNAMASYRLPLFWPPSARFPRR
ncbi:Spermidine export protein MdtI [Salmonella enterica subsp. enterica]|uniref:Spermidine export protein MdtI n=1 Tax=Salmonella enterica I TaxID=59201 RepID=A0A379VRY6_SALET|nr:Spermidine export protein MdtI [Salmonella enterica subsp. enterica]